ncbi:MAG: carbohydrate binding domain-containing protein [Candidatus Bathyarchaeota archaeon]|nr:carbohydrate binding domain-containing protein [Candidatus Bathyarchaeota archaeon]
MKKTIAFEMILLVILSLLPVFGAKVEAGASDVELYYDDGTAEAGYAWTATPGVYAVHFSGPISTQFYRVVEVRYFIHSNPYSFKLDIRDKDVQSIFSQIVTPASVGWFDVSLASEEVIVKGDFYVAMEYLTILKPYLGADYNDPDGESYEDPWPLAKITSLDWMIRVVVSPLENLIENPDFEQQLTYWSVSTGTATYLADSGNPRSGSYSAKAIELNEGSLGRLYQDMTGIVSAGGRYKISGWIKTQNVVGWIVIALDYVATNGWTPADGYVREIGYVTDTQDWTYYESDVFTLPPMPSDASAVWFLFDFNAGKGTAWWDDVSLIEVTPPHIDGSIDIAPDTLNLKSEGKWITAYIELPEGNDPSDIEVSTIELNGEIPAELHPTEIGDYDADGIPDLMVKFDRQDLIAILNAGEATLTITGEVDGIAFEGTDTIEVIG